MNVLGVCLVVFGAIFALIFNDYYNKENIFSGNSTEIEATITKVNVPADLISGGTAKASAKNNSFEYEYVVDEITYSNLVHFKTNFKAGDKIKIEYLRGNPEISRYNVNKIDIESLNLLRIISAVSVLIGIVMLVLRTKN